MLASIHDLNAAARCEHLIAALAGLQYSMTRKKLSIATALIALLPVLGLFLMSWFSGPPPKLGVTDGRLTSCPDSPNCVSSQADDDEHRMEPIRFETSQSRMAERVRSAIGSMPRSKIVEDTGTYIRAEFTSAFFRFVDDVEFLIDEEAGLLHFRSASRIGHSDLGANRKRMERLRELVTEQSSDESTGA